MRIGIGYDIHRIVPSLDSTDVPLGGIRLPSGYRVHAHSDGDVLLHALVDACLGALALGDIGQWFPDNAPENAGRPSEEFVQTVMKELDRMGWRVLQVDSIIHAEEPKVAPHADKIRENLARLLKTELSAISVKAKTAEGLGPVGERQAIAAEVVVQLEPRNGMNTRCDSTIQ